MPGDAAGRPCTGVRVLYVAARRGGDRKITRPRSVRRIRTPAPYAGSVRRPRSGSVPRTGRHRGATPLTGPAAAARRHVVPARRSA
ncbi:hypothetical protein AN218_17475 [Streptomyces nanshensis]|uniref:Uncharacterized protein n=1 Tax=Streptomyces nanshensis TaxID=518642 RepID=A0A1E7L2P1_9ACTN|nr:hypothetical protein AN218_17475 [Streptomyces nanshensis]